MAQRTYRRRSGARRATREALWSLAKLALCLLLVLAWVNDVAGLRTWITQWFTAQVLNDLGAVKG